MGTSWHQVWSKPTPFDSTASERLPSLQDLIVADGFNTGFGDIEAEAWVDFVDQTCRLFDIRDGDSVYDVGCGAGAFLQPAHARGIDVGGIDYSASRIELARRAMPGAEFDVGEAIELAGEPTADVVLSFGVFMYFPTLDYADEVIGRMCAKATRAVAILDVPDLDLANEALEIRRATAGGAEAYAQRYEGLDHLAYSKIWLAEAMKAHGLREVATGPQTMAGYDNARFRFNAWGWMRDAAARA